MAANPFLFTEDDIVSPNQFSASVASNPFLLEDAGVHDEQINDNPFFSTTASSAPTNPFAFDPDELETGPDSTFVDFGQNESLFSAETEAPVTATVTVQIARKPTDLDLKYGHEPQNGTPARPPPPAPSKETQALLSSVMGAMDATSSSLLDKIPPTRTPSPVSMRDLHSPSPTPETNFGDFLDVGDKPSENANEDLLGFSEDACDINQNPSQKPEPMFPVERPVRPPRPAPPPKPPPPAVRPLPPKPPPPAARKTPQNDIMDMFDVDVHKKQATKDDILNLYNAPIKETPQTDLLCDSIEPQVINAHVDDVIHEASPLSVDIAKESLLSPEVSNDLQMDTSDSQSKGSVSSVTFNPFAGNEDLNQISPIRHEEAASDVFQDGKNQVEIFSTPAPAPTPVPMPIQDAFEFGAKSAEGDDFDAFAEKFEAFKSDENKNGVFEAFSAWGNEGEAPTDGTSGFGNDEPFDSFLALQEPPSVPQSTPNRVSKAGSQESDEEKDFSVVIRPRAQDDFGDVAMPIIAPPPAAVHADTSPRFNPFDQQQEFTAETAIADNIPTVSVEIKRTDSQETPPTPLFDDDISQPLEPFPRIHLTGEEGWEMQLRQPNKKKITGQRFWKKIFVKLAHQPDCVLLQLYNQQSDKDPFQELPLQPCYSVSDIGAQQYDQFGKIFTVKLQYIFYKERPGVRPGQVKKAERITNKLSQFAAYAIQGDYQGVKEFGSDLKKLGLPVEHAPQVSQLMKLGSLSFEDLKQFSFCIEEALFKLSAHRDRALHYKMEEVQITAVDELYVEQNAEGSIEKQIARVRLFFLGFLTGMPDIELGVNDMRRQGKEVVGRHDIIPVVTEEWIRLENVEFHSSIQQDEYNDTHIIKFKPPDACYIEILRFRVRPPKNRELPLQLKAQICITGTRVELRADVLVPGFASRKLGQIPCEDVMIRFPIPECWIYMFRVEKHFRYGSVKSAHRRTGKIKGIERILGTVETLHENLIEVTSGQAKYEHQHRAIVWRCPRLPKEGQGAYTTHNMVCRIALTSYDQMPDKLAEYAFVEFTMPATQVSHTTVRSVSLQNSDSDEPPEKYVRYLARHEYRVGIEHTEGENPNPYATATYTKPAPVPEEKPAPVVEESSSDSD